MLNSMCRVCEGNARKSLKMALAELSELEEIANKAEKEYEAAPMDVKKEKAFDEAYKAEFDAFTAVVNLVVNLANGRVNEKTARELVRTKRSEIVNLVA